MNRKKDNVKLIFELILFSIGFSIFIAYLIHFFFYVDGYFQFNEWMTSIVGLTGALIGGIITMAGVVYTLNSNISDKENETNDKIKKIKFILKYEIETFVNSLENEILNYTEKSLNNSKDYLKYNQNKNKFKRDNLYKMDIRFKEYMYYLILLDNNLNGESNNNIDENLIELYKNYSILIEKDFKTVSNIDDIESILYSFLDIRYVILIDQTIKMNNIDTLDNIIHFLEDKEKIFENEILALKKDIKEKKNHNSYNLGKIIDYLEGDL